MKGRHRAISLVFCATLLACALWQAAGHAEDFVVGVGTHSAPDQGLAWIQEAGITSLRDDIHWQEVEREKGVLRMPERYDRYVDAALRRGIEPVLILCYGNPWYDGGAYPVSPEGTEAYARFAEFVVAHFRARVRRFEVWNEWNIGISLPPGTPHGSPEPYVALLRKVYPRLKAINPESTIIGGALSGNGVEKGWLETACQAGLLDYLDAFSFHPYCYRRGAWDRVPENGFLKLIHDSQEVTRRYQKRNVPIYLTEVGWPNHDGPDGSTPAETAQFLARTYLLARTLPFVRGVWWYDLRDDGADPKDREHHFGLFTRDFAPKPAAAVLQAVSTLFREARFDGEVPVTAPAHLLKFRAASGALRLVGWSSGEHEQPLVLEVFSPAGQPHTKLAELGSRPLDCQWTRQASTWRLPVNATGMPCVLDWDPSLPDPNVVDKK